jgi:SM-20-related protein
MTNLDYARLAATPLATDPFPHVVVPDFVPADRLAAVVAALPPLEKRGSFPPDSVRMGAAARELMTEMEGSRLRDAIADKFGLDLRGAPTMVTLRGRTEAKDGRIHTDSTAKRVTVLLYLNPETEAWARRDGCLRLLRGPSNLDDYVVEVPPVNGTLLVFPNGPNTWHGHRQYIGKRYAVQLNYMTTDAAARSELRRHRISAFVKKLTMAA